MVEATLAKEAANAKVVRSQCSCKIVVIGHDCELKMAMKGWHSALLVSSLCLLKNDKADKGSSVIITSGALPDMRPQGTKSDLFLQSYRLAAHRCWVLACTFRHAVREIKTYSKDWKYWSRII